MPDTRAPAPLTLTQIGRVLLRRWWVIVLSTLIVAAAAFGFATQQTPLYTATTTEYFAITTGNSAAELSLGSNYLQDQMASYGQLATSPVVLNPVIDSLALNTNAKNLARAVAVTTPRNTVVLRMDVSDADPARAAAIANALAQQLSSAVGTLAPKLANGRALVAVQSIQPALPPGVQSSPNKRRDAALGALAGLLLSAAIVLALSQLSRRVSTPETLAELTEAPLLGVVRSNQAMGRRQIVIPGTARTRKSADDVRRTRAAVERLQGETASSGGLVLAVTSAIAKEGRSTLAANLAASLTEAGRSCVLVDADLREPAVAGLTGTGGGSGLARALDEPENLGEHLQTWQGVDVLASDAAVGNPTALLSSAGFERLVARLRETHEFVVLDTPPLLGSADATDLADLVDGFVVVASARRLHRDQLDAGLRTAEASGAKTFGIVLNDVREADLPAATLAGTSAGRRQSSPTEWAGAQDPAS
jgi:succinoglycan biosynthesis transport protein ExoP